VSVLSNFEENQIQRTIDSGIPKKIRIKESLVLDIMGKKLKK
jgi:hypothetical protein